MLTYKKFSAILIAVEQPRMVFGAIKNIRPFVDEVILIYSDKNRFESMKKLVKNDDAIHIFYSVSLGLAEMYKQYAESLCKNEWILALDPDEQFNKYTLSHLNELAIDKKVAYEIRRKETHGHTWQYRIWKKGSLEWRGFVHEHPLIKGKRKKLNKKYEMIHKHLPSNVVKYNVIQKYQGDSVIWLALKDWIISYILTKTLKPDTFIKSYRKHRQEKISMNPCEKKIKEKVMKNGVASTIGSNSAKGVYLLNKKYGNEQGGIDLLVRILIDKCCK